MKKIAKNDINKNKKSIITHHTGASAQQAAEHALAINKNGVAIQ